MTSVILPHTEENLIDQTEGKLVSTIEMRAWMEGVSACIQALGLVSPVEFIEITGDYTVTGPAVLICTNSSPITVTLHTSAVDTETLIVKRLDDLISFTGTIEGSTTETLGPTGESYRLTYTDITGDWTKL